MTRHAAHRIPDYPPDRPKVPEVVPLVEAYYRKPGNDCGGNCHVVLDDGNLDADSLRFCLENSIARGDEDGAAIMRLMLQMTPSQRRRVYRRYNRKPIGRLEMRNGLWVYG
jgi:hypothetical protein